MIKLKNDGYVFISDLGIEYELLEGASMGADKQYTSDIVFIMLMDANYNADTHFVDYLFGATTMENRIDEYEESIREIVRAYEKRNNITERIVENVYTWKDIVEINGKHYAEEHIISGEMDNEDIYQIDSYLEAVADKHNVDVDDIKTYMMDDIEFNPKEMPYGAEDCGCYINGIAEWLID